MLAEKTEYLVKMVARLLEVSRSGFYPWLADGAPTDGWGHARDAVERVWLEGDRRFGERMVHAFLPPEPGPAGALPRAQVHARAGRTRRDALADGHQEAIPTSDRLLLAGNHLFHHTLPYCLSIMTALLSTGLFL